MKIFFTPTFTLFYLACMVGICMPTGMGIISSWWLLTLPPLYLLDMIGQVLKDTYVVTENDK
jgi:hypothetical protein